MSVGEAKQQGWGGGPSKQEQEPASSEIVEVAPGVLRLQLPISMPGLGHVNTYALMGRRGLALIDPGLPTPESFDALTKRLKDAGFSASQVGACVVTHSHPDHYGGVRRLAELSGAALLADASFGRLVFAPDIDGCAREMDLTGSDERFWTLPRPWDGGHIEPPLPARKLVAARLTRGRTFRQFVPPAPTRRLVDGDKVELGGRLWSVITTPGHTLDHLCFYDPSTGVLISGDHILPTITPHIPGAGGGPDPLSSFVASLDKVAAVGEVATVLPAHGHPFSNFHQRIDQIKAHHAARLQRIRDALGQGGALSVEEASQRVFDPSHWGAMAESETFAHLEHLRLRGEAVHYVKDGRFVYELA